MRNWLTSNAHWGNWSIRRPITCSQPKPVANSPASAVRPQCRHAADVLREQGRRDESDRLYAEVLETYRASQGAVRLDLANALRGYALLKGQTGAVEEACRLWREAGDLYHSENVDAGVDECAKQIAALQAT